uniref:Putative secreted peptide n=1 Tax=Anopheles braziliensis TaxID=58242 RepID=A0A2M3ZTX1_9DIPT
MIIIRGFLWNPIIVSLVTTALSTPLMIVLIPSLRWCGIIDSIAIVLHKIDGHIRGNKVRWQIFLPLLLLHVLQLRFLCGFNVFDFCFNSQINLRYTAEHLIGKHFLRA